VNKTHWAGSWAARPARAPDSRAEVQPVASKKKNGVNLVHDPVERAIQMGQAQFGSAVEGLKPNKGNPMKEALPHGVTLKDVKEAMDVQP
jgi:hypothetical protein